MSLRGGVRCVFGVRYYRLRAVLPLVCVQAVLPLVCAVLPLLPVYPVYVLAFGPQ
jgi:hypothetical protein